MTSSSHSLGDPDSPGIAYRVGASGQPTPVIRGTGIRVQTIVIAAHHWKEPVTEIANGYDLDERRVRECLAFYQAHRDEIDGAIRAEEAMAP
jgi:uncharacterized protein (DUF433 family)